MDDLLDITQSLQYCMIIILTQKAVSAEQSLIFSTNYRQLWRLYLNKLFMNYSKNFIETVSTDLFLINRILDYRILLFNFFLKFQLTRSMKKQLLRLTLLQGNVIYFLYESIDLLLIFIINDLQLCLGYSLNFYSLAMFYLRHVILRLRYRENTNFHHD